jgi:hypothetical protein
MAGSQAPRWRFLISPRWLAWHLFAVVAFWGMLWLGDWQLHRALSGNGLSWAYTFEWPIFAVMGAVFWVKTIRDEFRSPGASAAVAPEVALPAGVGPAGLAAGFRAPASAGGSAGDDGDGATPEEQAELAAYNAYLARLHKEVKGHGKWHGLR